MALALGTEIFQFQLLGHEKMRFKVSNPTSKSITKSTFLWPSLPWVYWEVKHPLHLTIPLSQKKIIDDKKCFKNRIKKYSNWRQECFNSKYLKRKLGLRKFDLVMLLNVGLPTFNPIFSGPKSWNWKISVPINKRTSWGFQNSPYLNS